MNIFIFANALLVFICQGGYGSGMESKRKRKPRKPKPALPPPGASLRFLLRLAPKDVGMFRFLLEAHDNLAYFTVLDPKEALLTLVCSPHQEHGARAAMDGIATVVPVSYEPWPFPLSGHAASPAA